MIYISIDTETCGLNPDEHTLLQFGAIIEDTEKKLPYDEIPKFEVLLESPVYCGTPFALSMHGELFKQLALPEDKRTAQVIPSYELGERFAMWLVQNGVAKDLSKPITISVAGKNFGTFDMQFLLSQGSDWTNYIQISHRLLDPAMLFWDPIKDKRTPGMEECKIRAGFTETTVAHTTLADAWDVIQLLRTKY